MYLNNYDILQKICLTLQFKQRKELKIDYWQRWNMKKYGLALAFFLMIFFGFSSISCALLSQSISPDESWLTIYQDIDRAWVVEKVALPLRQGENRFFLTGENLLGERFYFHPLSALTALKAISTTSANGYQIEIEAQEADTYSFLLSFFRSGFNWKEQYRAIWDEEDSLFYLYPSVFLYHQTDKTWKNVHISWLWGKPVFLLEEVSSAPDELFKAAETQFQMAESEKTITMERVSEYQVFNLPYIIDLPGNSVVQVFPEERKFPAKEIIRIEGGNEVRILKMKNQGDPLPPGEIVIFRKDQSIVGNFTFPEARTQEELEIPIGVVRDFQTERIETSYKRLRVEWNENKDVAGFWSQKVIRFSLFNYSEARRIVEILEPLPQEAKLTGDQNWKWENGKADLDLIIEPHSAKEIILQYEFREDRL